MSAITIRVPSSLYGHVKKVAVNDGMSINQFFVTAVAEKLSALDTEDYLKKEAAKGSSARGLRILARVPNDEPEPRDVLPAGYSAPGSSARRRRRSRAAARR